MNTRVIGQPLNRIDGRLKVTGAARYAADRTFEGLAYAVGITSTIAAGEILGLDARAAESAPGVIAVLHAGNVERPRRCPEDISVGERRPPFEDNRITYAGQFVALVIAETFEQARWAAHLVNVRYQAEDFVISLDDGARVHGLPADPDDEGESRGDPSREFERAAVRLDQTYTTPVEVHNAIELHAAVARWEGDRLIVDDSTQWVVGQREALAETFGLPKENVEVRSAFIGGGFGSKLFLWPHSTLAALAARHVQRPVKLVIDRRSQFTTAGHRPFTRQRIRIGATPEGRLASVRHDSLSHTSLVHEFLESCTDVTRSLYRCSNVGTSQRMVPVNVGTPTPMRGPGETPGMFALECALDELAVALAMDPLELRLRNMPDRDEGKDLPWSAHTHRECLELATRRFGWDRRGPSPGSMRDGDDLLGWGLASATWPGHRDEAHMRVEFHADGTVRVACATQDIGTGTYTVIAQVVSEITHLPFERIDVVIGNSSLPEGPISGGSMVTATVVPAVAEATRQAVAALKHVATRGNAPFAGRSPAALELTAAGLASGKGAPIPFGDVLQAIGLPEVVGNAHAKPGQESEQVSIRSFGAHCVEIRWDPQLARLRVSRVVSVIDAGRIINRKTAANQVHGAITMGLGMALLEQGQYDPRTGRVVNDNLADYLIPVHAGTPDIDLTLLDRPDPNIGEFGARGIGEIGLTGIAPAIANAVYHATGRRLRHLPISIEKLL